VLPVRMVFSHLEPLMVRATDFVTAPFCCSLLVLTG
jgi:hypothetical protein